MKQIKDNPDNLESEIKFTTALENQLYQEKAKTLKKIYEITGLPKLEKSSPNKTDYSSALAKWRVGHLLQTGQGRIKKRKLLKKKPNGNVHGRFVIAK